MTKKWWLVIALVVVILLAIAMASPSGRIKDLTRKLPRNASRNFQTRNVADVWETIIHHTAGNEADTPEDIATYHSGPNHVCESGCPGILYHYMVDRKGTVYRTQPLNRIVWHTENRNSKQASICLLGNYNDLKVTPAVAAGIRLAIRDIEKITGNQQFISTHRDHKDTDCPGKNVNLDQII